MTFVIAWIGLVALVLFFQPRRSHALKPIFRAITSVVALSFASKEAERRRS